MTTLGRGWQTDDLSAGNTNSIPSVQIKNQNLYILAKNIVKN